MEARDNQSLAVLSVRCYQEPQLLQLAEQPHPSRERRTYFADTATKNTSEDFESLENEIADRRRFQSPKKRGRPRLDASEAAVLPPDRRTQIRRAQNTYRLKKEATFQSCKIRVAELESKVERMAELFSKCDDIAVRSDLHFSHPALFTNLREIRRCLAPELENISRSSTHQGPLTRAGPDNSAIQVYGKGNLRDNPSPTSIFGYQVSEGSSGNNLDQSPAAEHTHGQMPPVQRRNSPGHMNEEEMGRLLLPGFRDMGRLFLERVPFTYSFNETMFSRRLHRYCLEHAYRLFIDPRTDPTLIYQVFRLVPCIRDKTKMSPYFQKLVRAGIGGALEIPTLPFYCIGGAGKHYPRKDDCGHPIYPSNMRLPRKVLGVLPIARTQPGNKLSEDPQSLLKMFGFDGEWFDCQDVQGYLEEKGAIIDRSSMSAEIRITTPHHSMRSIGDISCGTLETFLQTASNSTVGGGNGPCNDRAVGPDGSQTGTRTSTSSPSASRYVLDVECFFTSESKQEQWLYSSHNKSH